MLAQPLIAVHDVQATSQCTSACSACRAGTWPGVPAAAVRGRAGPSAASLGCARASAPRRPQRRTVWRWGRALVSRAIHCAGVQPRCGQGAEVIEHLKVNRSRTIESLGSRSEQVSSLSRAAMATSSEGGRESRAIRSSGAPAAGVLPPSVQGVLQMNGHCLCGRVRIESPNTKEIGGVTAAFVAGGEAARYWRFTAGRGSSFMGRALSSSPWDNGLFCKRCAALTSTTSSWLQASTSSQWAPSRQQILELVSQIYVDKKPPYYAFANETPMLTEQEVVDSSPTSPGAAKQRTNPRSNVARSARRAPCMSQLM